MVLPDWATAVAMIYDALIVACARKAKASRIYTLNPRHFRLVRSGPTVRGLSNLEAVLRVKVIRKTMLGNDSPECCSQGSRG